MNKKEKVVNPDDVISDSDHSDVLIQLREMEDRVSALERMLMRILDTLELDYPSITM